MATSVFGTFHAAYAPCEPRIAFDPARHAAFEERVPPELAQEWRDFGFGAYGNGILWTPAPDEPFLDPSAWKGLDRTCIEVLRSAFADVCVWQGESFLWLNAHSGNSADYGSNVQVLFHEMTQKTFRRDFLLEPLFKKARKRLGDLAADECFGFAPLPALGGAMTEEFVIKVKMREYLAIAAQAFD